AHLRTSQSCKACNFTRSVIRSAGPSGASPSHRPSQEPGMSSLLARIARALTSHWKRSLGAAVLVIIALGFLSSNAETPVDDFKIPGAESQKATDLFRDHAPSLAGADAQLVFTVRDGSITDPARRAAIESALNDVRELKGVAEVGDPFEQTSRDGRLATTD